MESWSDGVTESWSDGVMEFWSDGGGLFGVSPSSSSSSFVLVWDLGGLPG
jgi:hypothetical protein